MSFPFDPRGGLVIVPTCIWGPEGDVVLSLALDTGATSSMIAWSPLMKVGYDPARVKEREQVITGSAVEFAPVLKIRRIEALGLRKKELPIICHTLPPGATVDGVLGLDFVRRKRLTLDFRAGLIVLE